MVMFETAMAIGNRCLARIPFTCVIIMIGFVIHLCTDDIVPSAVYGAV